MNEQIPLVVFSLLAVFCVTSKDYRVKRWGPIFGLCSQPFWVYATATAGQWGMLGLSGVYTVMWGRGVINDWIAP